MDAVEAFATFPQISDRSHSPSDRIWDSRLTKCIRTREGEVKAGVARSPPDQAGGAWIKRLKRDGRFDEPEREGQDRSWARWVSAGRQAATGGGSVSGEGTRCPSLAVLVSDTRAETETLAGEKSGPQAEVEEPRPRGCPEGGRGLGEGLA